MSAKLIFLLLFFVTVLHCQGQHIPSRSEGLSSTREVGHFYHKNYLIKDYHASFQNWGGLQDKHDVMFFSNGDGVLSYHGKTWTLIETPTQSVIRSMAIVDAGKIFVGALDDFGYLDRSKNGKHIYVNEFIRNFRLNRACPTNIG